ncbi:zinc-binding dehydrogenase [Fulvivirga lutea]|uniref:Zinc-binding dehydrogenase n=1 Tax=Fulvivirga lutea TaxID=2810512 RepID=A0A974WDZ6_9BACT|nr:zinc-binding dehydrogenase [Fulvivirga lutea]QSE96463.1 zinc-binding dehydrogenase [Fulvivirga lutea]
MNRLAYRINKAGNINRLKLVEEPLGEPEKNEVQIEVKAIGLNFADIFAILGLYSATPKGSFVPGLEFCGVISKLGSDVSEWEVGNKVMGVTRFGGYANYLNLHSDYITKLPDGWSYAEGAGYLVQALTAYYGLFNLGNIQKGHTVLIHSAAGGVGIQANRMAKKVGAYTIGTIGSSSKIDVLKREGYDDFIVRDSSFKRKLEEKLKDRELNIVMECIGGKVFKAGFELLAPQGRLINYGSARYGSNTNIPNWPDLIWKYLTRPKIDPQGMIESNKAILGFNLIWLYHKRELMRQIITEMEAMNLPAPFIGHTFEFEQMHEAIKLFQSGKTVGKVVVTFPV